MRKIPSVLPGLLVLCLFVVPATASGQQQKTAVELLGGSSSVAVEAAMPAAAEPRGTLSLADGARTVAKGSNRSISVEDIFRLSKEERETILNDIDDYNVTPGKVSRSAMETLPMSSRLNVEAHPELFTIE